MVWELSGDKVCSDRTDEVVKLPGTVVGETLEETVDSERTDVVVELPESVVGEA